jgi:RNA polymerase sigma factor (sigma-70 family)
VVMSTLFSTQSAAAAVSDLRVWSEQQLIAAAKSGRRAPFGELCERHMKQVSCVTRRIVRNREDAEDAAQECFLNAFVHLKDFDGRSRFATWLTRIAINAALMKLRKNRGAREVPIDEPNPSSEPIAQREFRYDAPDPEESCSVGERKRIVKSAISGLRPRARNVVELIHLQEHSIRETGQILRDWFNAFPLETERLGEDVTMLSGPGGSVVVLNGPDGKFVVDTFVAPAWPRLKKALDGLGNAPVKYVIDTHWHFDHTDNNAHLHAAGATVLAHENTKKRMSEPHDLPVLYRGPNGALVDVHVDPSPVEALPQQTSAPVTSCKPMAKPLRSNTLPPHIRTGTSTFILKRPT